MSMVSAAKAAGKGRDSMYELKLVPFKARSFRIVNFKPYLSERTGW